MPMRSRKTAEEEYRLLAIQSRALADWEINPFEKRQLLNPFEKRQLLLAAQRYDILADRSKRAAELRSRKKSA